MSETTVRISLAEARTIADELVGGGSAVRSRCPSAEERFWSKVTKTATCWLFGNGGPDHYGRFWDGEKAVDAHIFSYRLAFGSIPKGKWVLHTCDVKRCVRNDSEAHLYAGTRDDNMRDAVERGRIGKGESHYRYGRAGTGPLGEQHGCAKLTRSQVDEIRARHDLGESHSALGRAFGVHATAIGRITRWEVWR